MLVIECIHATAVAVGEAGVLLRGAPGAGKSDLALRLMLGGPHAAAGGRPIRLVADDQVLVEPRGGRLMARAPAVLSGKIEVRGIGILDVPIRQEVAIALVIDLVPREAIERLPPEDERTLLAGMSLPRIALHSFDVSAPLKVILALDRAVGRAGNY